MGAWERGPIFWPCSAGGHFWYPLSSRAKMRGEGCVQLLKYGSWATSAGFADFYVVQTISPNFGGDFSNLSCFLLFKVWAETHVLLTLSLPRVINLRIQPSPIGRLRFETPERGFSGVSIRKCPTGDGSIRRLKSDQLQISPAASPEILHNTVWSTWLFIAYSDEDDYTTDSHCITHTFLKVWENVLFDVGSERVKLHLACRVPGDSCESCSHFWRAIRTDHQHIWHCCTLKCFISPFYCTAPFVSCEYCKF